MIGFSVVWSCQTRINPPLRPITPIKSVKRIIKFARHLRARAWKLRYFQVWVRTLRKSERLFNALQYSFGAGCKCPRFRGLCPDSWLVVTILDLDGFTSMFINVYYILLSEILNHWCLINNDQPVSSKKLRISQEFSRSFHHGPAMARPPEDLVESFKSQVETLGSEGSGLSSGVPWFFHGKSDENWMINGVAPFMVTPNEWLKWMTRIFWNGESMNRFEWLRDFDLRQRIHR